MFHRIIALGFISTLGLLVGGACDADTDATPPQCPGGPELVEVTAPDTAAAGATITLAFEVKNFEFSMGGEAHHDEDPEGGEHEGGEHEGGEHEGGVDPISADTGCTVGHVHVYLDDLMTEPLAQITVASGDVVLPAGIEPGEHRLINRLHDASHKIIEPQVVVEHPITIQ